MNIVTLWLKVMKSCQKKLQNCEKCAKVCKSGKKLEKVVKWVNRNWTRCYKELLSQSVKHVEVLQMWPRHMVSMLFPWHFSGILWHPGGMLWNAMKFHGIQKIVIVSMVSMLFSWHFSGI